MPDSREFHREHPSCLIADAWIRRSSSWAVGLGCCRGRRGRRRVAARVLRGGRTTTDLVVVVARRGAGSIEQLVGSDLLGAFAGKTVAHLHAVALALPSLAANGSITLVTAGSAQSALPGTAGLAAVNGKLRSP